MSTAQIDQMVSDLLQMPYVPHDSDVHGGEKLGDCSAGGAGPQITYLGPGNGSAYKENGTASGCGIMIIESGVTAPPTAQKLAGTAIASCRRRSRDERSSR